MTWPDEDEPGEFPEGEYTLVILGEEHLAWYGDAKSAAYQEWLEKVRRAGRMT